MARRRFLRAFLGVLAVLLAGGLVFLRMPDGAREKPASESKSPLPDDLAERLRTELDQLGLRYRGPHGEERDFRGTAPPPDWEEVLSLDPAAWGPLVDRFQSLKPLRSWLSRGGHPEDLPPPQAEALQQVDRTFLGQGLCRPCYPYLYLKPASKQVAVPQKLRPQGPNASRYESSDGWIGTALQHLGLAQEKQRKMESSIQAFGLRSEAQPPDFPAGDSGILRFLAFRNPQLFQQDLWHQESARRISGPWTRELGEHVRAFLYASFRGLEPGGCEAQTWGQILRDALEDLPWWELTEAARLESIWILGREPRCSGDFLLASEIYYRQTRLASEFGWPSEELLGRTRVTFRQCLQSGSSEGASESYLEAVARIRLGAEFHLGFPQDLLQRFRQDREYLLLRGWTLKMRNLIPAILWAGRARENEIDQLTRTELRELIERYRSLSTEQTRRLAKVNIPDLLDWAEEKLGVESPEEP